MSDPLANAPYVKGLMESANLGAARGSIQIETRDLRNVQAVARGVGQGVERDLGKVDASAKRLQFTFTAVSRSIKSMQGELVALGAGGALLTGLGLRVAASFEEAEIQLTGLVGTQEKARALMDDIRKRAAQAGLPFSDMLAVATRLLPTLEGNTEELGKWYDLARRVAVLNRQEGVAGAAFSINEAISSGGTDLVSLAERFNISRFAVREAMAQTGNDFGAALDLVLTKMGITQETADAMGQTFSASLRAARDAAAQLVGEGLTPVLTTMTPILQASAQWLAQMRETNPEIGAMAAGMLVFSATLPPALLLLNQMIEAMQKLKAAGLLGALGRGGLLALGAGAAVYGSAWAARGIGRATGNEELAQSSAGDMFGSVRRAWQEFQMWMLTQWHNLAQFIVAASVRIGVALRAMVADIVEHIPGVGGRASAALRGQIGDLEAGGAAWLQRQRDAYNAEMLRLMGGADALSHGPSADATARVQAEKQAAKERTDAIVQWATSVRALERETAEARLQATQQYEAQRTSVIASYGRTMAREAEDFARQRARQQAELERRIADIARDAAERRAEWQAELNKRIAEIRDDGNERITEIEEDYQRSRERAERSHRETLMGAAARLDATAVLAEQRRYAQATQDAAQAHAERVHDEQASINERIAQEQEAHAKRLEAARRADEQRIEELRRSLAEQQRMEDEDRRVRLERMAEDHGRQLRELDETHRDRLAQIDRQAARERLALDEAFQAQMAQFGEQTTAWLRLQAEREREALKLFDEWWQAILLRFAGGSESGAPGSGNPPVLQPFADGGPVMRTGPALVHAGEYVLNPRTTAALNAMMGGFDQNRLLQQVGGKSMSVTFADGAIRVAAGAGQTPLDVARAVRDEVADLFRELAV